MENVYIYKGDRYLCLLEKDNILSTLKDWNVVSIDDKTTSSELYYSVNSKEIFGSSKKIFVLDGVVPSPPDDFVSILEKQFVKNRKIIWILSSDQKVDKRTKLGKFIAKNVIEYSPILNDRGYIDNKNLKSAKSLIREKSGWNGSDECLDLIIEKCNYQYGSIFNEIEKIRTYMGSDPKSVEDINDILSTNDFLRMEKIFASIKSRDLVKSLEYLQDILDSGDFKNHYMLFFLGLLDEFSFLLACKMALDEGISDVSEIVDFVLENYYKNGKKSTPQSVQGRYFFNKDYLKNWELSDIQKLISLIDNSIKCFISDLRSDRFIVENFLAQTV